MALSMGAEGPGRPDHKGSGRIYSLPTAHPRPLCFRGPAPIVQRPRTPPFQGGNGDSNSPGGTNGGVVKSGVHAGLSSRRSRVQIPSLPPDTHARVAARAKVLVWSGSSVGRALV